MFAIPLSPTPQITGFAAPSCHRYLVAFDIFLFFKAILDGFLKIALKMRPKTNETNTGEDEEASLSRELFHTAIPVGSKIGEENGLEVILDIENFNFAYHKVSSQGLKVAVHDHRYVNHQMENTS